MKVFCIGMFKTGTTTLGEVFERIGLKTFHGPWWEIDNDPFRFDFDKFMKQIHLLEPILDEYDAFQDYPFMFIYPYLVEKYPNAKFILSERDPLKVSKSDRNMWLKLGKKKSDIPPDQIFINRYIEHNKNVKKFFKDSSSLLCVRVGESEDILKLKSFLDIEGCNISEWPARNKGVYGVQGYFERMPIYWKFYWAVNRLRKKLINQKY